MTPTETRSMKRYALALLTATALASFSLLPAHSEEAPRLVPAPTLDESPAAASGDEKLVLAGGCFWGVQGVFQHVKGVRQAVSGYSGGQPSTADYRTVSTGGSGHAESVEITYDPKQVTIGQLLQIFFSVVHDPTQLDGQGNDIGTQYRSAIFVRDEAQKRIARAYIEQLNQARVYDRPIVTRTDALRGFYPAEAYHQDYLTLHPDQPYIAHNDLPKVENFRRLFAAQYRAEPALVASANAK